MLKDALNFFVYIAEKIKSEDWNIEDVKQELLEILFPTVCGMCGKLEKNWICERCYRNLSRFKVSQNLKNINLYNSDTENKAGNKEEKYIDKLNLKNESYYGELLYIFPYKSIVRNLILQYKFNNKAYISNLFATIILKDEICYQKINSYDIIIPVPMFEKKKKQRGYNQTELIAEKVVKKLDIKLEINNLIKIKNTKVQSTLTADERKENIKNAFFVNNKDKIKNKRVIIFDDIFTTGETVNEISRILKDAGAKEILILVLAKD